MMKGPIPKDARKSIKRGTVMGRKWLAYRHGTTKILTVYEADKSIAPGSLFKLFVNPGTKGKGTLMLRRARLAGDEGDYRIVFSNSPEVATDPLHRALYKRFGPKDVELRG